MPRIISIDYGLKRTGIAVTDPLQIIATGLTTVAARQPAQTDDTAVWFPRFRSGLWLTGWNHCCIPRMDGADADSQPHGERSMLVARSRDRSHVGVRG